MTQQDWHWHCTTPKKMQRYLKTGSILPPVRAWENYNDAIAWSFKTGRQIILRVKLKLPERFEGHQNKALISYHPVYINEKGIQ